MRSDGIAAVVTCGVYVDPRQWDCPVTCGLLLYIRCYPIGPSNRLLWQIVAALQHCTAAVAIMSGCTYFRVWSSGGLLEWRIPVHRPYLAADEAGDLLLSAVKSFFLRYAYGRRVVILARAQQVVIGPL
jgi:hypothetical protein